VNIQALKTLPRKYWLMIVGGSTLVISAGLLYALAGSLNRLGDDEGVPAFMRRQGDGQSLYAQISSRKSSITEQNTVYAKYDARKVILEGMKTDIAAARKRLPTEAQKAEVRQLIEDLARQVGVGSGAILVKSVSIRQAAPAATNRKSTASDYQTIEYQTSVTADMDGIIQFINLIERNERFMTVEGIQLTSGGVSSGEEGKIHSKPHTVQLRIVTYIDSSGRQLGGKI
jgi:hypothetical protein